MPSTWTFEAERSYEKSLTVLIVDDHLSMAEAMVAAIRGDSRIAAVTACADIATALATLVARPVDVVLLDVMMPGTDGIDCIEAVRSAAPGVRVIVLTGQADRTTIGRAAQAGASGFVSKARPVSEVIEAIVSAPETGMLLSHLEVTQLTSPSDAPPTDTGGLSRRELDVLRLLADGRSVADISHELFLSVHTSRDHLKSIFRKLGARSQLEAVVIARQRNILPG